MASVFSKNYMKDVYFETRDAMYAIDEGGSMNKDEVRRIIEGALNTGTKSPSLFELPKVYLLKSTLESCKSMKGTIEVINENRDLIMKSFGLSDVIFQECVESLNGLKVST